MLKFKKLYLSREFPLSIGEFHENLSIISKILFLTPLKKFPGKIVEFSLFLTPMKSLQGHL